MAGLGDPLRPLSQQGLARDSQGSYSSNIIEWEVRKTKKVIINRRGHREFLPVAHRAELRKIKENHDFS